MRILLTAVLLLGALCAADNVVDFSHHNNTMLAAVLQKIHNKCPEVSRLYTLSESSGMKINLNSRRTCPFKASKIVFLV